MATCPHCNKEAEIARCLGCDQPFLRVRTVGRPKQYHSDECKAESKAKTSVMVRWAEEATEAIAV